MGLQPVGPRVGEAAAAVAAAAVELADSDSGLERDSGILEMGIGHDEEQDLVEASLGVPACAPDGGSLEVDQRVEGHKGGVRSLLDQMDLTAEVALESGSLPNDGCSQMLEEQVLGWFERLGEPPIEDLVDHLRERAGRLEDGYPVGLAHCSGLACRSPGRSEGAAVVP
jgi:hypothetical protein